MNVSFGPGFPKGKIVAGPAIDHKKIPDTWNSPYADWHELNNPGI